MEIKEQPLLLVVIIALIVLVVFGGAGMMSFGNFSGYGRMMNYGYGMMGGSYGYGLGFGAMWLFGTLMMILVVVALVLLILWLIKQLQEPERGRK